MMAYTCGKCESKQARTFSRHSYEQGVVLIRCESCDSLHLVADNLGWFEDDKVNIETIMKRKGENVKTNITEQGVEITKLDTTLSKEEASESQLAGAAEQSLPDTQPTFDVTSELRSDQATHTLLIQYAKVHESHAKSAQESVERLWPTQFNYFFIAYDEVDIANEDGLEVTVFPNQTELESSMSGTLVHSRI